MANKNIKKLGRKALSVLLTLTMVISLLQISAFAVGTADDPYDIGDTAYSASESVYPEGHVVEDGAWSVVDVIPAVYGDEAVCGKDEHTHNRFCCNKNHNHRNNCSCRIDAHQHEDECFEVVTAASVLWKVVSKAKLQQDKILSKLKNVEKGADGDYYTTAGVYLLYQNVIPGNIHQSFDVNLFGPSGDNVPYIYVTVNLNKLLSYPGVAISGGETSNSHWYISHQSSQISAKDYSEEARLLWSYILECMDEEGKEFFKEYFKDQFVGYVLKQESESISHIDGILEIHPAYVTEIYIEGDVYRTFMGVNEHNFNSDVLKWFDDTLEVNWNEAKTEGTFSYGGRQYKITMDTRSSSNFRLHDGKITYVEKTDDFYVAAFYYNLEDITPIPDSVQLSARKELNGRDLEAGEFSFQLIENGSVLQTKTNAADGSVSFDPITYAGEGVHTYTIKEVKGDDATITYDETEYTVTVTVEKSGNELVATISGDEAVFENIYTEPYVPVHIPGSITVTKVTNGDVATPDDAVFTLSGPGGYSESVSYSEFVDGKYTFSDLEAGEYTLSESGAEIRGYELDAESKSITLGLDTADNGDTTVSNEEVTYTNTYTKKVGSLKITKNTSGEVATPAEAVFTISGPDGYSKSISYSEFVNGVYEISGLALGKYFVIESNADIDGYDLNVTGTKVAFISATGDVAEITLNNEYTKQSPKVGSLTIQKSSNKSVPEGATFTISGPDGYEKVITFADFDEVGIYQIFDLAPGAYTVIESEAGIDGYDLTVSENNTVTVVAGSAAELEITNTYTQKVGGLKITKNTTGNTTPAEAEFIISGPNYSKVVKYSEFVDGVYEISGLAIGTYTVTESGANIQGYDLKVTGNGAEAVVAQNETAEVTITNEYTVTHVPQPALSVVKEADVQTAKVGDVITYTITVTNTGDATASGITIVDTPDSSLTISEVSNDGELADGQITWSVATLPAGISWSATVKAVVRNTGALSVVNIATAIDEGGNSDSDEAEVVLQATLKIKKSIVGLDAQSESALEKVLSFTVTDPNGDSTEYLYTEFKRGELKIEDPIPGVYTVVENNAEVAGYILDNGTGSWEVEVSEGGSAETLTITNEYTGKTYNIWFDGGNHGDVRNDLGNPVAGVWRNLWTEIHAEEESYFDWSGFGLKEGWKVYQKGIDDTNNLYDDLAENHEIAEGTSVVLYHFTWAQWLDYKRELSQSKPGLSVEEGWKSDREFYLDGGETAFASFEAAVEYMNANPEATIDANGFYNAYYVAKYENDPVDPPYVPPYIPSGGDDDGDDPDPVIPPVIIEEPEVPLAELPEEEVPLVELPEEEVPLADVPKTGDALVLQMILSSTSGLGLIALALSGKKREEEDVQ